MATNLGGSGRARAQRGHRGGHSPASVRAAAAGAPRVPLSATGSPAASPGPGAPHLPLPGASSSRRRGSPGPPSARPSRPATRRGRACGRWRGPAGAPVPGRKAVRVLPRALRNTLSAAAIAPARAAAATAGPGRRGGGTASAGGGAWRGREAPGRTGDAPRARALWPRWRLRGLA